MKQIVTYIGMLAAVLALCQGCDFIRSSLGKPTSADLAEMRKAKEAAEQAARDSALAAVEREVQETAERMATKVTTDSTASTAAAASPLKKYYAVAGAFQQEAGAQHFIDKLQEKGFQVRTFDFKNGLKVVCIEGSDSLDDVRKDVAALREMKLSDSDPWIYNTNQKLHK